jgi:hypothetical protein
MDAWEEDMENDFPDDQLIIRGIEERGAKRERERILALLARLHDSEYEEIMTHDDLVELIEAESNWADSVQETKKDWPE